MLTDASPATARRARRGLGFLGVLLIGVNLRVGFVTVGPLLEEISRDLGISAGQAGLLTGLPLAMFALFSPVAPAVAGASSTATAAATASVAPDQRRLVVRLRLMTSPLSRAPPAKWAVFRALVHAR